MDFFDAKTLGLQGYWIFSINELNWAVSVGRGKGYFPKSYTQWSPDLHKASQDPLGPADWSSSGHVAEGGRIRYSLWLFSQGAGVYRTRVNVSFMEIHSKSRSPLHHLLPLFLPALPECLRRC